MNYLAHLFLAGKRPGFIVGNILEDFVRGNIENETNSKLPIEIKLGILQHRHIDTLTDTDENVKNCKKIFYADFGKYAGIVVDVLFDHFLVKNWDLYASESFEAFRPRIHAAFDFYKDIQPEKMINVVASMKTHDWLKNYAFEWGLERAFLNMNSKINKPDVDLRKCLDLYNIHYDEINENFLVFFEKLKAFCDNFILENPENGQRL
jgi:acyl carrier protein phosphodiesterase